MSGGTMGFLYLRIAAGLQFARNTPERRAFAEHLEKIAKALHDIEWVDSGDWVKGRENAAIQACLGDWLHAGEAGGAG
jgi:hypothetical protein